MHNVFSLEFTFALKCVRVPIARCWTAALKLKCITSTTCIACVSTLAKGKAEVKGARITVATPPAPAAACAPRINVVQCAVSRQVVLAGVALMTGEERALLGVPHCRRCGQGTTPARWCYPSAQNCQCNCKQYPRYVTKPSPCTPSMHHCAPACRRHMVVCVDSGWAL